ncbi:MAG: hypothetical protein ACREBU_15000 [Nitrososphaera sp.]
MKLKTFFIALGWIACVSQAAAQVSDRAMQFTIHDPCGGGNAEFCAPVMVGRGVFDATTLANFKAALDQHRRQLKIVPPGTGLSAVIFSSPGGSLAAGLALGRELRRLKIDTRAVSEFDEYVRNGAGDYLEKPLLRNAKCLSACAYAFLGGSKRVVEGEKVLGVHQFRSMISSENLESDAQAITAQLSLFVESMGVSPKFMTIASLTRSNEITYLGTELSRSLKVDNVNIALAEWTVAATNNGAPILSVNQAIDQSHGVIVRLMLDSHRLLVGTNTSIDLRETRADRPALFPEDEVPSIIFHVDGKEYKGVALGGWKKTTGPGVVTFASVSAFPEAMLIAMQRAHTLSISDDFGRAIVDLSLATKLSVNGLSAGAALLSRTK